MKSSRVAHLCAITLVWAALPATGLAQVARIEIDRREPFADGQSFGEVGPYERLVGSLYLEVDPDDPANQRITDIHHAPVNQRGRVEVRTDFYLLKPVDPSRGSGRLLYDVNQPGWQGRARHLQRCRRQRPRSGGERLPDGAWLLGAVDRLEW